MSEKPVERDDAAGIESRPADPFVASRVPDPAKPAAPTITLSGLLGDSDRADRRRLYLNTRLDYYVEFLSADVVAVESLGPDVPPFLGLDSTRVTLARDARVEYVRASSVSAAEGEGFALDVMPAGLTVGPDGPVGTEFPTLPTDLDTLRCNDIRTFDCTVDCSLNTCGVACTLVGCVTRNVTCGTTCGPTCGATCLNVTCGPTCAGATCQTCGQATCRTCNVTCVTCRTCNRTCLTLQATLCNLTCQGCITQNRCPTLVCP